MHLPASNKYEDTAGEVKQFLVNFMKAGRQKEKKRVLLIIPLGERLRESNTLLDITESSLGHILKTKVIGNQCILLHCLQNYFFFFVSAFSYSFFFFFYPSPGILTIKGLSEVEENMGQKMFLGSMPLSFLKVLELLLCELFPMSARCNNRVEYSWL